ncbi:MAG: glycosyltransferase family 4 protein [Deltaproteobacteria bacterium]|nr:glycosyltransferase family 4 protein [Deltaproteobacteria bacterium]
MKILHLFSDWKWTGPAEPVINLCQSLQQRGHEVVLAYRRPPFEALESVEKGVMEKGIKGIDRFRLAPVSKPYYLHHLKGSLTDIKAISRYIDAEGFEIVNVHNSHDHIVGGLAARASRRHPPVIRMDHKRDSLNADLISRWFFGRYTDGLITFSEKSRKKLIEELGFPQQRVVKVHPALDLQRFDPRRKYRDMRTTFSIPQDAPVVGIVARFQRYRRTDLLLEAFSQLIKTVPDARLLLVGRSSQMKKSVLEPMRRLGFENSVVLAGYRKEDYLDTLACMDIFTLISPGSDGTARALREAMAMGKPVVVTRRGMLPELVQNGITGFVVQENPEALYQALLPMVKDEKLRSSIGRSAHEMAQKEFRLERQAEEVETFYQRILEKVPSL